MRASRFAFALMLIAATSCIVASLPSADAPAAAGRATLPPSEATAKAALETTPRHGEYVDISIAEGEPPIRAFVAYPERKDKAGVVIVIHEVYGLTDWIRSVADQLAADGFIAVAPDLISGLGPGGGGTDSVPSRDDIVKLVRSISPERAATLIDAVRAHAIKLPAANGKVATLGFCWGGGRSFAYAAATPPPQAAVVYYGASPDSAMLLHINAPVLGLYGADDARVNATIDPAKAALKQLKRSYEPNIFEGAGHGFLRQQDQREGANLKATQAAWPKTIAFLRKALK